MSKGGKKRKNSNSRRKSGSPTSTSTSPIPTVDEHACNPALAEDTIREGSAANAPTPSEKVTAGSVDGDDLVEEPDESPLPALTVEDIRSIKSDKVFAVAARAHLVGKEITVNCFSGSRFKGICLTMVELGVILRNVHEEGSDAAPHPQMIIPNEEIESWHLPDGGILAEYRPEVPDESNETTTCIEAAEESTCTAGKAPAPNVFKADSEISQENRRSVGRPLQRWMPEAAPEDGLELQPAKAHYGGGDHPWDQFAVNEELFGVVTGFDESEYTTMLDRSDPSYKEKERDAIRIARQIEMEQTRNPHLREERNQSFGEDYDEESRYSSVDRQGTVPRNSAPVSRAPAHVQTPVPRPQPAATMPESSKSLGNRKDHIFAKTADFGPGRPGVAPQPRALAAAKGTTLSKSVEASNPELGLLTGAEKVICSLGGGPNILATVASSTAKGKEVSHGKVTPSATAPGVAPSLSSNISFQKLLSSASGGGKAGKPRTEKMVTAQKIEDSLHNAAKLNSRLSTIPPEYTRAARIRHTDDKEVKRRVSELKEFASTFKLNMPFPPDLAPIIYGSKVDIPAALKQRAEAEAQAKTSASVSSKAPDSGAKKSGEANKGRQSGGSFSGFRSNLSAAAKEFKPTKVFKFPAGTVPAAGQAPNEAGSTSRAGSSADGSAASAADDFFADSNAQRGSFESRSIDFRQYGNPSQGGRTPASPQSIAPTWPFGHQPYRRQFKISNPQQPEAPIGWAGAAYPQQPYFDYGQGGYYIPPAPPGPIPSYPTFYPGVPPPMARYGPPGPPPPSHGWAPAGSPHAGTVMPPGGVPIYYGGHPPVRPVPYMPFPPVPGQLGPAPVAGAVPPPGPPPLQMPE